MWRRERAPKRDKNAEALRAAGLASAAGVHAARGDKDLAKAQFEEALEVTSGHPKTQAFILLQRAEHLYGGSSKPDDLVAMAKDIGAAEHLLREVEDGSAGELLAWVATAEARLRQAQVAAHV